MSSDASGARRASLLFDAAFVAIVALYFVSASRFFEHVEDAVISYTYARNFADGYGFVVNIGGERVEGFSNPLWVFLLAGGSKVFGASPFMSSRVLGIVFSVGELVMAYRLYRDHLAGEREPRAAALLAPAMLACMPGFQMWNHMGLENPMFGFFLALATWLHLGEIRDARRFPWSALPLLGLLLTRPEAPLYVACILAHKALHIVRTRRDPTPGLRARLRRAALWATLLAVPFAAFVVWRIIYFGWPLAMPYYVKLAEKRTPTLGALVHGDDSGMQYLLEGLWTLRVVPLLALAVVAPVFRRATRGPCLLLLTQCLAACFFTVYSGGDWMKGWRWLHVLTVPLAPLAAAGLTAVVGWGARRLAERMPERAARAGVVHGAVLLLLFGGASVWPAATVTTKLAADLPVLGDDVHERLDHWMRFADAFFVDRYSIMDGDQGALTYFAPPNVRTIDPVGLNDVTSAQHRRSIYVRSFWYEYFFGQKPTFYGPRKSPTSVPRDYPEWVREYTLLPAFVSSRMKHAMLGGWMRKDVFRVDALPEGLQGASSIAVGCGLLLRGARVLAPVVDAGAPVRFEAYWQAPKPVQEGFDYFVELALVDDAGHAERRVIRPFLHQAYAPTDWSPEEILRDPEELVAASQGAHAITLRVYRTPRRANRDVHTPYGPDPLPLEVPDRGLEACVPDIPDGASGPLQVARFRVDPGVAQQKAGELEAAVRSGPLADAPGALTRLAAVLGPGAARTAAARRELSERTQREELAEGQRLLGEGRERDAADALLRARAEDVRAGAVNDLLRGISKHLQAAALDRLDASASRTDTCAAYRGLLDAVAVYPPNAHARHFAETAREECWSVLTKVDFGEVDDGGALAPDEATRVFPPGRRLGLRFRWRDTPNLGSETLPLEVRLYGPDGAVAFSRNVTVSARHGETTVAWPLDTPGRWRFEAQLEGRLETSLSVDVEAEPSAISGEPLPNGRGTE
jgi:hypothetical protein